MEALHALEALRVAGGRDRPAEVGFVIGVVGPDVPTEMIRAVGALPLRLRGNPQRDMSEADRYLGLGLDPATRAILAGLLDGAFGSLDAVVVSSDCDASQRLYYALREIHRVEPETSLPPAYLIDILHLPRESTARYNSTRLGEFAEVLRQWTGVELDAARLRNGIERTNRVRSAQREVLTLRDAVEPVICGADALAIIMAADRLSESDYLQYLLAVRRDAQSLPRYRGKRVFLTGSDHDRVDTIQQIEDTGVVIVGEDHSWGETLLATDVLISPGAGASDLLDAIGRRYQLQGPTTQRGGIIERAEQTAREAVRRGAELVLSTVRVMDEAALWDFGAQRQALRAQGIPAGILTHQRYDALDSASLSRAIVNPESTDVNGMAA